MRENALELHGVCKKYGGFAPRNVGFTLPRGTVMGLIGENGAGKTTTIKAVLDLMKRQIESGLAETSADEVLILTDLWGGSVNTALLGLTQDPRVHIIAGMNLNLVLQLCLSPEPLAEVIPAALKEAQQGMIYGNAVLACPQAEDELF